MIFTFFCDLSPKNHLSRLTLLLGYSKSKKTQAEKEISKETEEALIFSRSKPRGSPRPNINQQKKGTPKKLKPKKDTASSISPSNKNKEEI